MVVISALKFVHVTALCYLAPCAWSPRVADPCRHVIVPCARTWPHIGWSWLPWLCRGLAALAAPLGRRSALRPTAPATMAAAGATAASAPTPRRRRCRHRRITTLRACSCAVPRARLDVARTWPCRCRLAIDCTAARGPRRS